MTTKKKPTSLIAALAVLTTLSVTVATLKSGYVKICLDPPKKICQTYAPADYTTLKDSLLAKVSSGQTMTPNEYLLTVGIYNYELKKKHGFSQTNVSTDNEKIFKDVTTFIK